MTFFKKQFGFILLLILLTTPAVVLGAGSGADLLINGAVNVSNQSGIETTQSIPNFIGRAINSLFALVGVIFLGFAILGGIKWMMAGGNEEKVGKAKKMIIGGVEGTLILFLSYTMVYFVVQALSRGVSN